MNRMIAARRLYSIGFLSGMFQTSPAEIRAAAAGGNLEPALYLNDVAHYDEQALPALRARLSRLTRAKAGREQIQPRARRSAARE
jgi:hypothetical protein